MNSIQLKQSSMVLRWFLVAVIIAAGFLTDMGSKNLAKANLMGKQPKILIPGLLDVSYTENRGMVFGILNDSSVSLVDKFLRVVRLCIVVCIPFFIFVYRKRPFILLAGLSLIFSGAIGNTLDTMRHGYVVDFLHIHLFNLLDWPFLFNLADVYLLAGMALLFIGGGGKKFSKEET